MGLLTMNSARISKAGGTLSVINLSFGRKINDCGFPILVPAKSCNKLGARTKVCASKKSAKKFRRKGDAQKNAIALPDNTHVSDKAGLKDESLSGDASVQDNIKMSSDYLDLTKASSFPSRDSVLQLSHVASVEGWPVVDCSMEIPFGFQVWHVELITGLVVLISSCRYLLLQTWPDFAESSEAANQQVLSSLQPLDYFVVAILSGFSEELLFRGTMLPLIGVNWKSALVVGIIFGLLHLGNGRKYSFAIWATFVGFAYGYATILSSSIIVPMASHAANNLVGSIIWRYTSKSSK